MAARESVPSAEIGRRSREESFPITNFGDLRYTGWGGGVPIDVGGSVIGAVGVSGLPEDTDVELAELGVRTIDS
jgi:glc operon protein GlcG